MMRKPPGACCCSTPSILALCYRCVKHSSKQARFICHCFHSVHYATDAIHSLDAIHSFDALSWEVMCQAIPLIHPSRPEREIHYLKHVQFSVVNDEKKRKGVSRFVPRPKHDHFHAWVSKAMAACMSSSSARISGNMASTSSSRTPRAPVMSLL